MIADNKFKITDQKDVIFTCIGPQYLLISEAAVIWYKNKSGLKWLALTNEIQGNCAT